MATVRVDRLEDDLAVLVLGALSFEVPRALLPEETREGDVLSLEMQVDRDASEAARSSTAARRARLSRDDDGGDFSL